MPKAWMVGALSFVGGAVVASGAWTAFPQRKPPPPSAPNVVAEPAQDDGLAKANASLTSSLHECDRRLAELGEKPVGVIPAPSAAPSSDRRGRRNIAEFTKDDWNRMAESGVVPVRIPCIRDQPWAPSDRVMERLGLSPNDLDTIQTAYASSNKRMVEQIRPICAQVLGSPEAADKVGTTSCIDVINTSARKASGDATKEALSRVAEVQSGKREAPKSMSGAPPVEQLAMLLTKESKTFEDDLASKFGPEEAHRLATAPEMCAERKMLRAGEVDPAMFGQGGRGNRGNR